MRCENGRLFVYHPLSHLPHYTHFRKNEYNIALIAILSTSKPLYTFKRYIVSIIYINTLKSIYMATEVIVVPAGTTKFKAYPDKREVKRQLTNWPRLCMHCKSWEGNHTPENRCQKYTKTIRINHETVQTQSSNYLIIRNMQLVLCHKTVAT